MTTDAIVPRSIAGTIGRVIAFVLLFSVLAVAATPLLGPPLAWLAARIDPRLRIDALPAMFAALAATGIMVRSVDRRPWADVGLARSALGVRRIGDGFLVGAAAIALACVALLGVGWLRIAPAAPGSTLAAAVRVSFFLVPAALSEELLCRGYLLTVVRERVGTTGAVVMTSVVFGLLHVFNNGATFESVTLVALAGVFLASVRVAYDSLYAAWAAHTAWNWVMAVPLHAAVSGWWLETPDYRTVSAGPVWITGGAWGPEGGVAAGLGMVAGLAYLYARRRREES
ncbi:MAG TPA: type II CAAX endopeptidase family protein [Gemmatimonadaceae bacterium]